MVSNAADALEKLRHSQMVDSSMETGKPLEIRISVDKEKKQFIIQVRKKMDMHIYIAAHPLYIRTMVLV